MTDTTVQIRLFGAFAVRVGVDDVPEGAWRLRKARSLVKLLALEPDRRIHRERATELLWPDRAPEAAANNFHQALYVARRALETAGVEARTALPLRDDMLALQPGAPVEVDVDVFEAAAAQARTTGAVADLQAALALHGGELLPEDRYEPWTTSRREALHETHLALLIDLADRLAAAGETAAATEALVHAVVAEPLHEAAHRALMHRFAADGRRQEALAQYHRLRATLGRELAAEPDPQTVALYRALLRDERPAGGPAGAASTRPAPPAAFPPRPGGPRHNLPVALTSFIGRGRELREVTGLLDRHRLVTLTGAGGAGKTRLAIEAASAHADACPDGVWLVELAGLDEAALVPAEVASALGLTLRSRRSALEGLGAQLAGWDALLVLDNCEHLVTACAVLAEHLLGTGPRLRVLATSREPLRVGGEVTWRVPSLVLPDRAHRRDPAELMAYESVRLFCERAADVAPGFALDADNAEAVTDICLRLDGMPLALELAAARVGALSPAQIADRLTDSLAVLTAGSRTALDRQQTLRATLRWSHDLLTDDERRLFRRLAVFAGSFPLEGAEAVAAGDGIDARDVADLLGRLVDKSLVVTDEERGGYRYRLLETMRQYANELLAEAGEAPALRARHFTYNLNLAAAADPEGAAAGSSGALDRLEVDHDNLRAALGWALGAEPQRALELAVRMWPMWMAAGHFQEGRRWLEAALTAAPEPTAVRAEALRAACGLEIRLGATGDLGALGVERVAIFRALGDRRSVAHALDEAGVYEYMVSRNHEAQRRFAESRLLAEELSDDRVAAAVMHSIAVLAHCRGHFATAREALLDSLARLRRLAPADHEPFFRVHTVGLFVAAEGPGGAPRMYFEETVQLFRRVTAGPAVGYVLSALGDVARAQGLRGPARERYVESLAHFRDRRDGMGIALALNRLGNLAAATGEHELARELLEEGLARRRELGDRRATGMTLGNLGLLAGRAGDLEQARSTIGEALALFEASDDAPGQMGMRLNLGTLAADAGDHDGARALLEASRAWAEGQRLVRCAGWATLRLAELAIAEGETRRAAALLDEALERLRALRDRWGVARALELDQAAAKRPLSRAVQR